MIVPNSKIILLKTPIELDEDNQLTFSSKTNQYNYFYGLTKLELDDATFMRKEGVIRYPTDEENGVTYDDLLKYNYCMYQNTSYGDKWFYAFITKVDYISNGTTNIKIKTDVYQTWCFDVTWKQSFIEREHIAKNNDIIGANTQPENLETGDYISTKLQPTNNRYDETCYCVATTKKWLSYYQILNQDLPTGCYYQAFDTIQGVEDFIDIIDRQGGADSINCVFVCPKDFFDSWGTITGITGNSSTSVKFNLSPTTIDITHVNYLGDEYYPTNAKLLTFPYSYLQVSNHSGTLVNYKWEDFNLLSEVSENKYQFIIGCTLTPSCSGYAYPKNYKNILNNYDEGITYGKFPVGAWNSDVYTNWLTQNAVNIPLQIATSSLTTATGLLAGNPTASISGILGIAQTLGSIYEHSLIPPQAKGNVNVGDFNFSNAWLSLEFKRISIKNEYARIIDDYFTMYGYKTNRLKLPNLNNRSNWNYVKTINANIIGDIPQEDMQEYKQLFNKGITLWHSSSHFLDYSQTNN
jgi:hypothetical protein